MNITIRKYENKDYLGLYNLYLQFETKNVCLNPTSKTPNRIHAWLNGLLGNPRHRHFIIEFEEHIAGHGVICPTDMQNAEISLFLGNTFGGKRVGQELLVRMMHEACLCMHLKKVWISVQHDNGPMLRLANEFGFHLMHQDGFHLAEFILEREISHPVCQESACPFFRACVPDCVEIEDSEIHTNRQVKI